MDKIRGYVNKWIQNAQNNDRLALLQKITNKRELTEDSITISLVKQDFENNYGPVFKNSDSFLKPISSHSFLYVNSDKFSKIKNYDNFALAFDSFIS